MLVFFAVSRIFILSPANSAGERARMLTRAGASFELARRLQRGDKISLGEIFSFLSGLYFRGKATYSRHFNNPPANCQGAYIITSNRGLIPLEEPVSLKTMSSFSKTDIDPTDPKYSKPLLRDCRKVFEQAPTSEVVLLGSIATGKYVDILLKVFGAQLLFPAEFVGRGDMSRGGLMLRAVRENTELSYISVAGAVRKGSRPAKLIPIPGILKVTLNKRAKAE